MKQFDKIEILFIGLTVGALLGTILGLMVTYESTQ